MKYQLSYDKGRNLINGKIEGEIDPDAVKKWHWHWLLSSLGFEYA